MRLPRSLQGRLLVLVLAVVSAVWLGALVATWIDAKGELDELLDSHLAQAAALLVAQQAREIEGDRHDRQLDAPAHHRYAPKVAFQVWHDGRLALRSPNAPLQPMSPARRGFQTLAIDGRPWRVFAARGAESDVQVFVGEQIDSRADILWAVMRSMLWPMALALPLLALAAWWAVRRGLAPLRQLSSTLTRREPQALQPVALADAPAEMLPLLAALNGLFERIAALLESERRFTADAAHELRTPIAAIRAQAQVALLAAGPPQGGNTPSGGRQPGRARDAAARGGDEASRHALAATLEGCDRAAHLVEQLLTLSRLEAAPEAGAARVDLAALARRAVADMAGRALDKGQQIELDAPEACPVAGDEVLLGVLLRNLVDNAIRYSPAQARVEVRVTRRSGSVVLQVQDSGPGLGEAERARLGERFFRVLGSGETGSGLGWSIVRRIAQAQGARIAVGRSASLGGLQVEVAWPALSRQDA